MLRDLFFVLKTTNHDTNRQKGIMRSEVRERERMKTIMWCISKHERYSFGPNAFSGALPFAQEPQIYVFVKTKQHFINTRYTHTYSLYLSFSGLRSLSDTLISVEFFFLLIRVCWCKLQLFCALHVIFSTFTIRFFSHTRSCNLLLPVSRNHK